MYSNGCNNEIFRIFGSSSADEAYVNTISKDTPTFEYEVRKTANHISQCVIISIHVERTGESTIILHYYFPWLSEVDLCDTPLQKASFQKLRRYF